MSFVRKIEKAAFENFIVVLDEMIIDSEVDRIKKRQALPGVFFGRLALILIWTLFRTNVCHINNFVISYPCRQPLRSQRLLLRHQGLFRLRYPGQRLLRPGWLRCTFPEKLPGMLYSNAP